MRGGRCARMMRHDENPMMAKRMAMWMSLFICRIVIIPRTRLGISVIGLNNRRMMKRPFESGSGNHRGMSLGLLKRVMAGGSEVGHLLVEKQASSRSALARGADGIPVTRGWAGLVRPGITDPRVVLPSRIPSTRFPKETAWRMASPAKSA